MHKQGYNAKLHESLGERHMRKNKQSMKARADESKGMEKAMDKRAYSSVKNMDASDHMKEAMKHMRHAAKKHKG